MTERQARLITKNSAIVNRPLPSSLLPGEAIVNTAEGILLYSGVTTSTNEWTPAGTGTTATFFEVGSNLYDLRLRNKITAYEGQTGNGLVGKFLSGTTNGFVLTDISNIQGMDSYVTGATWNPNQLTLNLNEGKPSVSVNISAFSALTITNDLFVNGEVITNDLTVTGTGIYDNVANGSNNNEIVNWSSLTAHTFTTDRYVTGGTYDNNTALITFSGANNFPIFTVDLSSIDVNDTFVTGGTISYGSNELNGTLILNRNDGNSVIISGFTDINTTGATLINNIVYFDTNESLSAYTLDLSSLDVNDTYSTGGTVTQFTNNNSNEQIIQITGNDGFVTYNITGLTDTFITGFTFTPNTLTISQNNGIDLSTNIDNFYVTGGTYNSLTESIDFVGNNPVTTFNVDVSALLDDTNTFTTGATLSGNTILFDRNDLNDAYSVDLTPILPEIPTNLTFYSTTTNSDVVGYSKLVISLDDPDYNTIPVNVSTGPITTQGQLIASLVSDAGIFAGNPGVINITTIGEIRRTGGSGVAEFYYEVYQRNNLGVETLIAISNKTTPVTTSVYQQFQASALFNNGTWLETDRVVIKYYGERIPGASNPTYEFLFGGTNPVRTLFPISAQLLLNVPISIGITGIVGGVNGNILSVDSNGKLSQINPNVFTDFYVTGGTFSSGSLTLDRNDGNSVIVTGFTSDDNYVTGGTYNPLTESIDFKGTNSTTTFNVDVSGLLDDTNTFTTGATLNGNILQFNRNDLTNAYSVDLSSSLFSGNYNDLSNKPTNLSDFNNDVGFITCDGLSGCTTIQDIQKDATFTVELIDENEVIFYAPYNLRINSFNVINGTGSITIDVNSSTYSLTDLVFQGDSIDVSTTTPSVVNLIVRYE